MKTFAIGFLSFLGIIACFSTWITMELHFKKKEVWASDTIRSFEPARRGYRIYTNNGSVVHWYSEDVRTNNGPPKINQVVNYKTQKIEDYNYIIWWKKFIFIPFGFISAIVFVSYIFLFIEDGVK